MRFWTTGEREAALSAYDILDTPREAAFDDVVEIACALTNAPVAMVSFVASERQWFKAEQGTGLSETTLSDSICAHAVAEDADVLVIPDTTKDPRTRDMDMVTGALSARAYAGAMLRSSDGVPLGMVCVLDTQPRDFSIAEINSLRALARQVTGHLELRRAVVERAAAAAALRDADLGRELALQAARLGRWDHQPGLGLRFYDERAREILGLSNDADIREETVFAHMAAEDLPLVKAALARVLSAERTGPLSMEFRVVGPAPGEVRWVSAVGRSLFANGVCTRFFGVFEDVTERKRAEELRSLLASELSHRVKNILSLAQSVVDSTLRTATTLSGAREAASGRLQALGHAHDRLLADSWEAAPVAELVASVTNSLSLDPARLEVSGPFVRLGSRAALQLALALHELATNAAKYGALSNDTGKVTMQWSLTGGDEADRGFRFTWRERGGPTVVPPTRKGFGTRVIERAMGAAFGGEVTLTYPPEGACWSIHAPLAPLQDDGAAG